MITIIAAVAANRAIGFENKLLYWLPNDLKRFKALTTGHTIIMGRRTFESLPKGALPNRRNVVLSRTATELEALRLLHIAPRSTRSLRQGRGHIYNRWSKHLRAGTPHSRPTLPYRDSRHARQRRCASSPSTTDGRRLHARSTLRTKSITKRMHSSTM